MRKGESGSFVTVNRIFHMRNNNGGIHPILWRTDCGRILDEKEKIVERQVEGFAWTRSELSRL
jgi:hypothetical protein